MMFALKTGTGKYYLISEIHENVTGAGSPCPEPCRGSQTLSAKPFQATCLQAVDPLLQLSELLDSVLLSSARSNMAMAVHSWDCNLKSRQKLREEVWQELFKKSTRFLMHENVR